MMNKRNERDHKKFLTGMESKLIMKLKEFSSKRIAKEKLEKTLSRTEIRPTSTEDKFTSTEIKSTSIEIKSTSTEIESTSTKFGYTSIQIRPTSPSLKRNLAIQHALRP